MEDGGLKCAFIDADTAHLSGGQIFAALRKQGHIAEKDGSAVAQHHHVATLVKDITIESALPACMTLSKKRKGAGMLQLVPTR